MEMRKRRLLAGAALAVAGGLVTWFMVAISFDPLFVAGGSAPATIWGSALSRATVLLVAAALLLVAVLMSGRIRLTLLLLWLLFLAAATHRLVEHSDGGVDDVWLGAALRTLPADPAVTDEARRCQVGTWLARCDDGAGRTLSTVAPLPFAPLYPGRWTGQ